jgi:hypothetical protein
MLRYALARHVFACRDGEHIVLLDLKQDRYFSLEAAKARRLDELVAGWPAARDGAADEGHSITVSESVARRLAGQGLLTVHSADALQKPATRAAACAQLIVDSYEDRPPRATRAVAAFVAATLTAAAILRWGSLERAVRRVARRRERRRDDSATFDIPRTRQLLAAFTDLKPLLWTSRDQCLFESFVLLEFLARHGVFPAWVFGVQARPFAAHCWVQQGDTVLNDTLEHLARYTPIMVV